MTQTTFDIHKAAGIIIKDRKLLIEKSFSKEFYNAPGGSIETGETPKIALVRELFEEFKIHVNESDLDFFETFYAQAANDQGSSLKMDVYIVKNWSGDFMASSEVEMIQWVDSLSYRNYKIGSIFHNEVIPKLKSLNLID